MAEADAGDRKSVDAPEGVWAKHANEIIGGLALIVLGVGTVVYHILEDWSWVSAQNAL